MKIDKILDSTNLTEDLSDEKLLEIGDTVVEGYLLDVQTRAPWEKDLKTWTELALQISSKKTFPWPDAANIKYPLLATAAMQFAARAYPTLVPNNGQVVKCRVIGYDMDGQKQARAERISKHMSYQVMDQMDGWEEDMDRLLITLPITGTVFKKTYWDASKEKNCSRLVLPKDLVVNYFCRSLEEAERVTEVFYLPKRKIKERQNQGIYRDIDLGSPTSDASVELGVANNAFQNNLSDDETTPYVLLEQHTYLDLDEDGYAEPYIVTVEEASRKVLRIVPRFNKEGAIVDEKNKVIKIDPIQYYTKYSFIPNPDGGFYDIGFGRLLGPLNNSANTIINQLVDAGSLSNLQAGFIGKGLRIKMGETRFQPGEWKAVNAVGDDLKKQIFPLPVREPSQVLFNLLDLLLKSGKELASVAEIFVGKMPGQNTPATTTMATIEQGMKVFTAVYKRVYRSLTSEFRKLYLLNREYMNPEEYISVLDSPVPQSDYEGPEDDIVPGADPTAVSAQEKQAKLQAVMQILQMGTIDPMWFTQKYLEAHEIPDAEHAIRQPTPQPDPKQQELQLKAQLEQQKAERDMQMTSAKLQMEQAAQEQKMALEARAKENDMKLKQLEAVLKARHAQADMHAKAQEHQQMMSQQSDNHQLSMVHTAQAHQAKLQQQAQQQKMISKEKPKNASNHKK